MKLNSEIKTTASKELQDEVEKELETAKADKREKPSINEIIKEHGNKRRDTSDNSESS